jgi:multiple sugar transport system substrate-binding protein
MKTLVAADLLQELKPDDLARFGMTADKFNQVAWKAGLVNGKIYDPAGHAPVRLLRNTAVCKKAGLLDSDGVLKTIEGQEAFLDALSRAKQASGQYGAVIPITNEVATPWRIFQSLYSQLGGQVLADNGQKVVLDDDKAEKVLTLLNSMSAKGLIPSVMDYQGSVALFATAVRVPVQGEWEMRVPDRQDAVREAVPLCHGRQVRGRLAHPGCPRASRPPTG